MAVHGVQALPGDILLELFRIALLNRRRGAQCEVDTRTLRALPLVCRAWAAACRDPQLWRWLRDRCFVQTGPAFVGAAVDLPRAHTAVSLSAAAIVWGAWTQGGGSEKGAAVQVAAGGIHAFVRSSPSSFVMVKADGSLNLVETNRSLATGQYDAASLPIEGPERIVDVQQMTSQIVMLGESGTLYHSDLGSWSRSWCEETGLEPSSLLELLAYDGVMDQANSGDCGEESTLATPTQMAVDRSVINAKQICAVACGAEHLLCTAGDGNLFGWGANSAGQLGLGDRKNRDALALITISTTGQQTVAPSQLLPPHGALAAGDAFSVVRTADGRVFTAGSNNHGQLGRQPPSVPSTVTARRILSNGDSDLLLAQQRNMQQDEPDAWQWEFGEVSFGFVHGSESCVPNDNQERAAQPAITAVGAGKDFAIAIGFASFSVCSSSSNGSSTMVWSWGCGSSGSLGLGGSHQDSHTPCAISSMSGRDVASVSCGRNFTVLTTVNGHCWSFGENKRGQLGRAAKKSVGRQIKSLAGVHVGSVRCVDEDVFALIAHPSACAKLGQTCANLYGDLARFATNLHSNHISDDNSPNNSPSPLLGHRRKSRGISRSPVDRSRRDSKGRRRRGSPSPIQSIADGASNGIAALQLGQSAIDTASDQHILGALHTYNNTNSGSRSRRRNSRSSARQASFEDGCIEVHGQAAQHGEVVELDREQSFEDWVLETLEQQPDQAALLLGASQEEALFHYRQRVPQRRKTGRGRCGKRHPSGSGNCHRRGRAGVDTLSHHNSRRSVDLRPPSPTTMERLAAEAAGFAAVTATGVGPAQLRLPPSLTSGERKFVHEEAERLGLGHVSRGRGKSRHIILLRSRHEN